MDKTHVAKEFGIEIRKLRKELGFTQEELALEADIDRSFMYKLERGLYQPSLMVLFKLCSALGYPPEKLVKKVYMNLQQM